MLAGGTPVPRPMAAAMSRNGMPSSATACSRLPAGAPSRASRYTRAASSVCTEGHRLAPSATYPDTPVCRAMPIRMCAKPWWSSELCTIGGSRTADDRTPRPASQITKFSASTRGPPGATSASVPGRPVMPAR